MYQKVQLGAKQHMPWQDILVIGWDMGQPIKSNPILWADGNFSIVRLILFHYISGLVQVCRIIADGSEKEDETQ